MQAGFSSSNFYNKVQHSNCVGNLTIIGSDNGLSPGRRQAIISTNAGMLLIGPLGTNFSEILIKIHTFSFKKMHLKLSAAKWRPSCLGLNVLTQKHTMQWGDWSYIPTLWLWMCSAVSCMVFCAFSRFIRSIKTSPASHAASPKVPAYSSSLLAMAVQRDGQQFIIAKRNIGYK